jgi:CRP/FNR family cyclic AMP-dependent transcriptional regulator
MDEEQKQAILKKLQDLRQLRIFYLMDEREIFEVLKRCAILHFAPGDKVFSEGDTDHSLYIIVDGNFEVASTAASGEKLTFFFAGDGLIFGEMSFLDSQPRSAAITAAEKSEVLQLSRAQYEDLLQHNPVAAARFMFGVSEILSRRLRGANMRIKHST